MIPSKMGTTRSHGIPGGASSIPAFFLALRHPLHQSPVTPVPLQSLNFARVKSNALNDAARTVRQKCIKKLC